ncbi:alpha/beta hydrolase [Baekduia sp. Peel2402]|uniref:alpha/beta hydrolase n=1 Tax=Baekduia sp. Peel2402 TaxID=3458296 RepID=UPI00403EA85A
MPNTLMLLPGRLEAWLGGRIGRLLFALPPGILRRLAGTPPAVATGTHPEALLLGKLAAAGPDRMSDAAPVAEQRKRFALQAGGLAAPGAKKLPVAVSDHRAPGRGGDIPVRLYVPEDAEARGPLLVYFHGGGWVHGSIATHDPSCRTLAHLSGVRVLSVDYRLAPEHPYPAAADDAISAYAWAADHAADLGADPARLAVGGDSAGGNLAAVVALAARDDERLPDVAFQLLLYPVTDVAAKTGSYASFSEGYLLTEAGMDWFIGHYVPDAKTRNEWQASPLRASSLEGLPPAYVATCLPDVLRDEGEAYAARLRESSVAVATQRHDQLHGFFSTGAVRSSAVALAQVAGALRQGLAHS